MLLLLLSLLVAAALGNLAPAEIKRIVIDCKTKCHGAKDCERACWTANALHPVSPEAR
jgi:hypothetical protein